MITYTCDRCGYTSEDTIEFQKFRVPTHIANPSMGTYVKPFRGKQISTSGTYKEYDLCCQCYNQVNRAAYEMIKEKLPTEKYE